jgi:hypothetical protein
MSYSRNNRAMSKVFRFVSNHLGLICAVAITLVYPCFSFMLHTSSAQGSPGGTFLVFGPADYLRSAGQPVSVGRYFNVRNPNASYTLRIFNGGKENQFARSSSAVVTVNGVEVAGTSAFNQSAALIERSVTLALQNTLVVEVRSAPGSGITIEIVGVDLDAPTVQITAPANGATLNTIQVTVTGAVSDATSGIAGVTCNHVAANLSGANFICQLQLTEGANTIVVRATDVAGNVATASINVTVSTSSVQTVVPRLADLSRPFAESAIGAARLAVGSVTTASDNRLPAGYILSQSPAYGTVVSAGSPVSFVVSSGPTSVTPPLSFIVDTSIVPPLSTLPGFADGVARPLASIVDNPGKQANFVENELLLMTDDTNALNGFIARWQGTRLLTIDPANFGMDGLTRMHLVRINTSLADASTLVNHLRAVTPYGQGEHRLSSQSALQLLTASAQEAANGLMVVVNWVGEGHDFRNRTTAEASTCVGCTGGFNNGNAYQWSFMNTSAPLNIGVTEAWTVLQRTGRIDNKVQIAILDMGFWPDDDFPSGMIAVSNVPPPPPPFVPPLPDFEHVPPLFTPSLMGCAPFEYNCPWHGTNVVGAAMGVADNNWGGAGPAGPVAQPILIYTLYDYATSIAALGEATILQADIINMSYGFPIPAVLSWTVIPFDLATLTTRDVFGVLIFASAGNDGEDVDATDLFWEETWYTPCENGGVNCVGALNNLNPAAPDFKAGYSNYGAEEVDLFAPGTLWVGPDPDTQGTGNAQQKNGTSFASPFAAGVAALIWAANPELDADGVERLMFDHARRSTDPQAIGVENRYVNAYNAVIGAMGGNEPPSISILSPANNSTLSRGTPLVFRASVSDREGLTRGVVWTSDLDGEIGTGTRLEITELRFGTHIITAKVTDMGDLTDMESITVTVANDQPPAVTITNPADRLVFQNNQNLSFSGTSNDPNNDVDPNNVPSRPLSDAEVSWHLDGSTTPFATGHTAGIFTGAIRPGMHAVTLTGVDRALPTTAINPPFTASDVISFMVEAGGPLPGQPPAVTITRPASNAVFGTFPVDETTFAVDLTFEGAAIDPETGALAGGNLIWTTRSGSSPEETLGLGTQLTARLFRQGLAPRVEHFITLYATDNDGNIGSQTVRIELVLPDSDLDGLSFDQEAQLGTDPFNADTDGDGVWDGAEAFIGTNPTANTSRPTMIPPGTLLASTSLIQGGALLTLIDPTTGNTGVLGRPNSGLGFGLAIDSRAGFLYLSRFTTLAFHDPLTGASTNIGTFRTAAGSSINISHIAFNPADNLLYGVEEGPPLNFLPTGQLVRIDPVTAVCTRIGNGSGNPRLNALAFNAAGVLFAAAEGDATSDRLIVVDTTTGSFMREISAIGFTPVFGLTFNPGGALLASNYVSNRQSRLLVLDPNTGTGATATMIERAVFALALMPCPAPCLDQPPLIHFPASGARTRLGDFNEDGNPDLVTAFGELFFGNSAGSFTREPLTLQGNSFFAVATGDLNRDGHLDVVTADPTSNRIFVYLGNGSGGFPQAQDSPVPVGSQLIAMAIGDLTNDGIPDLAASATENGTSYVDVLPGIGNGRFSAAIRVPVAGSPIFTGVPRDIAIGDLNGDGFADIASANTNSGSVMINDQAGGFTTSPNLGIPGGASSVVIGDFNNDSIQDLAFVTTELHTVGLYAGTAGGSFAAPVSTLVPTAFPPTDMAGSDMTGDGRLDLVIAGGGVHVMISNGSGGFRPALRSPYAAFNGSTFVTVGDLNNDGLPDVVVSGREITVLLNHR